MMKTITKTIFISCISVLCVWLIGFAVFLYFSSHIPAPSKLVKTDAIIVLTGGAQRVDTGLELLNNYAAHILLISGVNKKVTAEELVSLWGGDVSTLCCIDIDHEALNTKENALETKKWIENEGITSMRLVTSSYHMPRAILEFRSIMPDKNILPHPVKGRASGIKEKISTWRLTFAEYNKTLLTSLRLKLS